jgi:hypothetical protein
MLKNVLIYLILWTVFACKDAPKAPIQSDLSNENYADMYANKYSQNMYSALTERTEAYTDARIDYFPNLQAVIDTLNGYDGVERIFCGHDLDYNICIDKFEGKRIGIVSTNDFYILTQEPKKNWELMSIDSSFGAKWRGIRLEDINGDGFKDIKSVDGGGGYGASMAYFHLYNPQTKRFTYNTHFDGFEVSYDRKTHLVHKMCEQPRYSWRARYAIVADSLMIVDGLDFNGPEEEVIHTKYKNGQLVSTKRITKSIVSYFHKTLWKTKEW